MSDYVNHVVVCGYDESTHILLDALSSELNPGPAPRLPHPVEPGTLLIYVAEKPLLEPPV